MTLSVQRAALKAWIMSVSGLDTGHVILRNAGGPRPTGDYIVFDSPTRDSGVGTRFVSSESVDDEGVLTRTHTSVGMVRVGIDVMSSEGSEVLDKLELSAGTYTERARLGGADLAFVRRSTTIYIPEYGDTDPRDRYRADFFFYSQKDLVETDFELAEITAEITAVAADDSETTGGITVGEE